MFAGFYDQKRVFVTGTTGFKGSWLAIWLHKLGTQVTGYSHPPPTDPSNFAACALEQKIDQIYGDICSFEDLLTALRKSKAEIVFHLAAQAIVRQSYRDPVSTFDANVMGTVNLLEAVRQTSSVRAVIVVTSDKCYAQNGNQRACRESDRLGGHDPYSASKACAELAVASYAAAFCDQLPRLSTVRAGNVIGGGDWAADRLIPDCIRALQTGKTIHIRNPSHIRPWQHVLDPLGGYLRLAKKMVTETVPYSGAWNFGPEESSQIAVQCLVDKLMGYWGNGGCRFATQGQGSWQENPCLMLDATKAKEELGWCPILDTDESLCRVARWYKSYFGGFDAYNLCTREIETYREVAWKQEKDWVK